ncbi:glycosyltransferase [Flavobacterium sp. DGU11]|uniref:Glycosyltransferase n=1 Tax=Flavobacterium arundinis TaxID=3139143 RepID=A0ABU9HTD1_9FLAO
MGKVLFVHDGPILRDTQGKYFGIHYKNALVDRYAYLGEQVTFLMRLRHIDESESKRYSAIDRENFNFIEFPNFKSLGAYKNRSKAIKIIKDAVEAHDVIVVRLPSASGSIAFEHARKLNKPVLTEMVACVWDALWNYNWQGKILAPFKYYYYKGLLSKATHTVYVTSEFLQNRYPTNGKSTNCSNVVLNEINEQSLADRIKHINEQNGILTIGTVAAVDVLYKGQADVIQAVAKLKKEGVKFKYRIVGQGNQERLQNLIKELDVADLVEIVGPLSHDKVFEFLKTIDIYIQPSRQEGLPRAVIEAMSLACPALGTTAGGIPELLTKDCIFPKGGISKMCKILKSLDKPFLIEQAKLNFEKSKAYEVNGLNKRREDFYDTFKQDYGIK